MLAYTKPGVTVSEVVSPSVSPLLAEPTSICIVGPALGYQPSTEIFVLVDNTVVTLAADNIDPTSVVAVPASDPTATPFIADFTDGSGTVHRRDFVVAQSNGVTTIKRSMQTTIANDEEVVIYSEASGSPAQSDGKTGRVIMDALTAIGVPQAGASTPTGSVLVQKKGKFSSGDVANDLGGASGAIRVKAQNASTVVGKYQTVYVDWVNSGGVTVKNTSVQLNGFGTFVTIGGTDGALSVTAVKNASSDVTTVDTGVTVAVYSLGSATTSEISTAIETLDYVVVGSGVNLKVKRSAGTTQMGVLDDQQAVQVSYTSTPDDYWFPTRVGSQSDVEDKYGSALNTDGSINSPLSFAAALAFQNGASDLVLLPLFHLSNGIKTNGGTSNTVSITLQDWKDTLAVLRDIEDVNVIVPLASSIAGTITDAHVLTVFESVQDHISFMQGQNQYVVAVCGEDTSATGTLTTALLRQHGITLGARNPAEAMVLVSPGAFTFPNPQTGLSAPLGGQYVSAAVAGGLASRDVSAPATRKLVIGLNGVTEYRSEADKNTDASDGLLVVENKAGLVQIRHAVTTATDTIARRELNIVRAKYHMVEVIRATLDTQVIGQMTVDDDTPFLVQGVVESCLDGLVSEGTIRSYDAVQTTLASNDPTTIEVRFSYLPAAPLNYINIVFSVDTSSQAITTQVGA